MKKTDINKYNEAIKDLYYFMVKRGYTSEKKPKIILNNTNQGDKVFIYTGYFDPKSDSIRIFTNGRKLVDILKTVSHELIHFKQRVDGVINNNSYKSDKITLDKDLCKLESEAYLKGTMAFIEFINYEKRRRKN